MNEIPSQRAPASPTPGGPAPTTPGTTGTQGVTRPTPGRQTPDSMQIEVPGAPGHRSSTYDVNRPSTHEGFREPTGRAPHLDRDGARLHVPGEGTYDSGTNPRAIQRYHEILRDWKRDLQRRDGMEPPRQQLPQRSPLPNVPTLDALRPPS